MYTNCSTANVIHYNVIYVGLRGLHGQVRRRQPLPDVEGGEANY